MVNYSPYSSKEYNELKRLARKDMADIYRKIRKDNPAIARLLFKREKEALNKMINLILYGNEEIDLKGLTI